MAQNRSAPANATLVRVAVSVHDKDGRPVSGLTKESFQIFEDQAPQEISFFKQEDEAASVGIVVDDSGSMRNRRDRVNNAVLAFIRGSNPENELFVVSFGDSARLEQGFTRSISNLIEALDGLMSRGQTALYDAIHLSMEKIADGRMETKALLLVSDGEDNASRHGYDEITKRLKESAVTVYVIGLLERSSSSKSRQTLQEIADTTGGRAYFPKSIDEIEEVCKQVARDLRNRYTIGYLPTSSKPNGSWRDVKVSLAPSKNPAAKFTVRSKPGYFAAAK